VTVQEHAAQVAATLNQIGVQGSRLELPAGVPDRLRVAWALLRLTFDHAASISSNFYNHGTELAGSGFALLRPMNEALKRGTWFGFCATDAETATFIQDDELPRRNLSADIEQHAPFDQFPMFSQQYLNAWDKFHSFTHGGSQIVGAYTMGHGVGAAFPEQDIIRVLDHAEAVAMMAIHVMSMICGEFHPDLARDVQNELLKVQPAAERARHP
jgi:hypothetical protein